MYILSVEDDPNQAQAIAKGLQEAFHLEVRQIRTEFEFRSKFDGIVAGPPKVVVIDMMLPWCEPAPVMPQRPDDVKKGGVLTAGLRCESMLHTHHRTRDVPVVFYTVLENADLGEELSMKRLERKYKGASPLLMVKKGGKLTNLIQQIGKATGLQISLGR